MTDLRPLVRSLSLSLLFIFLSHTYIAFAQGIYKQKQDPSAIYGTNALIVLEALKQLSQDSKTGGHLHGLQERDGVPYIPFLDKSQQELIMLNQQNGSAQFSITKFMKDKLDPELASQITDEVEEQILLTIHQKAETAAISCEGASNENLLTLCAMCKTNKAYLLSDDNWFTVGLDNHYKDEFAAILYYVQFFIPTARLLVAFSEDHICMGSAQKVDNFDLNNLLKYATSKDLCYYTKFGIVPLETHATLDFAGFEYYPIGSNMSYITDLVVKYDIDHSVQIVDDVDLLFSKSWIRSKEVKHLYLGTSHINTHSVPFSMEVATEQDYYYAVSNVLPYFITGADVLTTLGLGTQQTNLFSVLHTDKGLSDLGSFTLSEIAFKFSRETVSAVGITLTLFETAKFAVTPEFSFKELHTTIDIEIDNSNLLKASSKLILEGTVVDSTGTATMSSIAIKTENHTELTLSQKMDLPALKFSELEKIFKAQDDSFQGLLSSEKNFDKFRDYYVIDLTIKVGQGPVPAYFISANLSEEVPDYKSDDCKYVEIPNRIGELQAAVAYIGGKLNSWTVLTFPDRGLEQLVLSGNNHTLIDKNLELKGFKISYMNHDLDTGLYPAVFAELYQGDRFWIRGTYFELNVVIKACNETAFCNIANSFLTDNPRVVSVLKGTIEKDNRVVLQSQTIQNNTVMPGLTLSNITLNFGLTLGNMVSQIDPYFTFWTALTVPKQDPLMLKGTISFNSTHAILVAKSSQVWENALNLKSLQISQLKITGLVKPGSADIEGVKAEGIAIWGTECFTTVNGTNHSVFNKERCFFGKNEININVKDVSKSHITGMYKNLNPSHIISLSDYNESQHDIPEHFMKLKFTDYVEVKYIPPKVETVLLEVGKAERLEAGLFIKGASQMYGLQGTTNLKMKSDGKNLAGTFTFANTEAMLGNVLIEGGADESQGNLNVIELNLLGSEDEPEGMTMEGKISVIGLQGTASWVLVDNSTSFEGKVESDLFEDITLKGSTNEVEDIKRAKVELQGEVNSDLSQLSQELRSSLNFWAQGIRKILDKNQNNVDKLKEVTEEKEEELCKPNECDIVKQCLSIPERKCVKYVPQEVCTEHVMQCQTPNLTCKTQENVLVGYASSSTNSGSHNASICMQLGYQCTGGFVDVCDKTETTDNEDECESYGWTCEEGTVTNFGCQSECDRRVRVHKKFQTIYQDTQAKIDNLRTKIQALDSFLNNTGSDSGLKVTKVAFEALADKLLVQSDFVWNVTYKLGDVEHSVSLNGLNLVDFEQTADSIFQEIGKAEGKLAGFEWKTLEEYNAYLNQEMIGNTPVGVFLELGAKKSSKK